MSAQQENQPAAEERCSICGDAREQVGILVEGFADLYVCDDCIGVLTELLDEARAATHDPRIAA